MFYIISSIIQGRNARSPDTGGSENSGESGIGAQGKGLCTEKHLEFSSFSITLLSKNPDNIEPELLCLGNTPKYIFFFFLSSVSISVHSETEHIC